MALTRRHCPQPPEGLGRSRFAVLHHNAIRPGLRANNSSATGVLTKARRGSGTDEVVKALGVLDVWAAQQLQARWRCIQVRRQFLLDHRGVDPTAAVKEQILRQRRASSSDLGAAQLGGSGGSNPPSVRGMGVVNQLAAGGRRSAAAQGPRRAKCLSGGRSACHRGRHAHRCDLRAVRIKPPLARSPPCPSQPRSSRSSRRLPPYPGRPGQKSRG